MKAWMNDGRNETEWNTFGKKINHVLWPCRNAGARDIDVWTFFSKYTEGRQRGKVWGMGNVMQNIRVSFCPLLIETL